ncbi:MAG TPA: DNA repair exonuclease [Puia sp.]|nr:DNA repair exonuclease [Puia sp.]
MKILASADLHLGKRSSGMRVFGDDCATRHTWQRIVDYAVRHSVDALVLAGDIIDRDNRYFEGSGALQDGFVQLRDAGVEVFLVSGNHDFDVLPQVLRNHPFDNVHLLGVDGNWQAARFERRGEAIQFIGWSFPSRYVEINPLLQLSALVTDPNVLRLGILHCEVDKLDSRYAPVPIRDLQNAQVDVWVLGHIHKPVAFSGTKLIRYPGSAQSLSAKETGAHGGLLLTVDESRIDVETICFSSCWFEELTVDISTVNSEEGLRLLVEDKLSTTANSKLTELVDTSYLVFDVHLTGENSRGKEIRNWTEPLKSGYDVRLATGTRTMVREVTAEIRPAVENLEALAAENSPAGVLAQCILALRNGTSTPLLDGIIRQWESRFQSVNNAGTYQPLQEVWQRQGNPRHPRAFIERECNRLLGELLYPSNR